MGALSMLVLLLTHPVEFRTLLQYKLWHEANRDITNPTEWKNSGWDRQSMRRCWDFLDLTSRSFAGVIKELEGDLARIVSAHVLDLEQLRRSIPLSWSLWVASGRCHCVQYIVDIRYSVLNVSGLNLIELCAAC